MAGLGENCVVLQLTEAPIVDDYGDATDVSDSVIWEGRAPSHLRRKRIRVYDQRGFTLEDRDMVIVRDIHGLPCEDIKAGDQRIATTILIDDLRAGNTVRNRYTVESVEHRAGGGIVDSVKLVLCDRNQVS